MIMELSNVVPVTPIVTYFNVRAAGGVETKVWGELTSKPQLSRTTKKWLNIIPNGRSYVKWPIVHS